MRDSEAPGLWDHRGAALEDLAFLTGGRTFSEVLGVKLEIITLQDLVTAKLITVDKDKTTIVGGMCDRKAKERGIKQLKIQIIDAHLGTGRYVLKMGFASTI